jgi:hypothetical protein
VPTLAAGDHRALYLAWLLAAQSELDDDEMEPSVPPNLASLSGPLHTLAAFLRIDEDLLAVAAQASDPRASDLSTAGLDEWVTSLPVPEKDALLLRVIHGDPHVHSELRQRFRRQQHDTPTSGTRTVKELLAAASARRTHRQQEAEHRAAAEHARREREAAIAREKRLDALAAQEEQAWHKVSTLIETKKPGNYDDAVALLVDLKAVGERAGAPEGFHERYQQLRLDHRGKPSLMQRLDRAGL